MFCLIYLALVASLGSFVMLNVQRGHWMQQWSERERKRFLWTFPTCALVAGAVVCALELR